MKTTILLTTLASIASLQTVSAAYWTVSYGNSPLQNGKYYAKYQYWKTSLAAVNDVTVPTELSCSFSQGNEDKSLLFNQPAPPYIACLEPVNGSLQGIAVRPLGSETELHALAVAFGYDIPCAMMEYGTGYETYICSNRMPVVDTPSVDNNTTTEGPQTTVTVKTSTTETAIFTTTKPATTVTKTTLYTTTNKPTTTEASCKSGYRGKRNGQGPNGACCSHSDDCKDTCVKGTCGVSP